MLRDPGVERVGLPVGGGDHHHPGVEQSFEEALEGDCREGVRHLRVGGGRSSVGVRKNVEKCETHPMRIGPKNH